LASRNSAGEATFWKSDPGLGTRIVIGGLALGFVFGLPAVKLEPDMVFLFLLPPLLYPAAVFTSWRDFRANLSPILLLAIGLVLLTTVFVAVVAHALTGLPWAGREESSPFWMARVSSTTRRHSSLTASLLRR
jgi:NhaP-type Na+/H+ or K+/H+ antiporter